MRVIPPLERAQCTRQQLAAWAEILEEGPDRLLVRGRYSGGREVWRRVRGMREVFERVEVEG